MAFTVNNNPQPVGIFTRTKVSFTAMQVGGQKDIQNTSQILLTFNQAVSGLLVSHITLSEYTGNAIKGTLTGSGKDYVLTLVSVITGGIIEVTIAPFGTFAVSNNAKVEIFKKRSWADEYWLTRMGTVSSSTDSIFRYHVVNLGAQGITGFQATAACATPNGKIYYFNSQKRCLKFDIVSQSVTLLNIPYYIGSVILADNNKIYSANGSGLVELDPDTDTMTSKVSDFGFGISGLCLAANSMIYLFGSHSDGEWGMVDGEEEWREGDTTYYYAEYDPLTNNYTKVSLGNGKGAGAIKFGVFDVPVKLIKGNKMFIWSPTQDPNDYYRYTKIGYCFDVAKKTFSEVSMIFPKEIRDSSNRKIGMTEFTAMSILPNGDLMTMPKRTYGSDSWYSFWGHSATLSNLSSSSPSVSFASVSGGLNGLQGVAWIQDLNQAKLNFGGRLLSSYMDVSQGASYGYPMDGALLNTTSKTATRYTGSIQSDTQLSYGGFRGSGMLAYDGRIYIPVIWTSSSSTAYIIGLSHSNGKGGMTSDMLGITCSMWFNTLK